MVVWLTKCRAALILASRCGTDCMMCPATNMAGTRHNKVASVWLDACYLGFPRSSIMRGQGIALRSQRASHRDHSATQHNFPIRLNPIACAPCARQVLSDDGIALRGLFIIDKQGVIQHATVNNLGFGRSVDETLRVLQAIQYIQANPDEVCKYPVRLPPLGCIPRPKNGRQRPARGQAAATSCVARMRRRTAVASARIDGAHAILRPRIVGAPNRARDARLLPAGPAGWKPGDKTMKPDPKGSKEYFAAI